MGMFGAKLGTWWVESKSDPRWDKSGRGYGLVVDGGPESLKEWISECRAKYGEPPEDAFHGFMKD